MSNTSETHAVGGGGEPHQHDGDHHRIYERSVAFASWLRQPLEALDEHGKPNEFAMQKKKIKEAQDEIIKHPKDKGVKENSTHAIEHAEIGTIEQCHKVIENTRAVLGDAATHAIQIMSERLGGDGPRLKDSDKPTLVNGPIPHDDDDHYNPGTIELTRIYEWLVHRTIRLLEAMNRGWAEVKEGNPSDNYSNAKKAFTDFMYKLDGFRPAIFSFSVFPVTTADGFIVSAKTEVKYIKSDHSSSSTRVT